jgi:hypothetical protein
LAKIVTAAAVFIALLCGQPDLLAVVCLYLSMPIILATGIAALRR